MLKFTLLGIAVSFIVLLYAATPTIGGDDASLKKALTFYASFDESLMPDVGVGPIATRSGDPTDPKKFTFAPGYNKDVYKIAKGKGVAGGCLEALDVLPNRGRFFYPVKGNLAFKKGGWGGACSMWINMDPAALKLQFCDPVQITQKGANNGGIWFDFNDAKPRDLRMGVFPAVADGTVGAKESDADAPMVRVPGVKFKAGEWHHVVLVWANFDTGEKNAHATLFIDGEKIGDVKDRAIAMDWDIEKAGIYTALGYTGLLDEMALFNRPLTGAEVRMLHKTPGLLAGMKK